MSLAEKTAFEGKGACAGCGKPLKGEPLNDLRPLADGTWVHYRMDRMGCWAAAMQRPLVPGKAQSRLSTHPSGVEKPTSSISRAEYPGNKVRQVKAGS